MMNLTVYSLGNFVSNQRDFRKMEEQCLDVALKKDKSTIHDKEYILTWVNKFYAHKNGITKCCPAPIKCIVKNT